MMIEDEELTLVERLAEEFAERFRRGERPSIKEYAERYPEQAEIIQGTFEALAMMERLAPGGDDSLGAAGQAGNLIAGVAQLDHLGDYRIIREMGRGGMGVVYEAEQVSLGRHVALKVLSKERLQNAKHRLRFEREAKAAAKLHHTNIVPVFGIGEDDGTSYYVMQFIQGLSLDEVLKELQKMNDQPGSATAGLPSDELRAGRRSFSAASAAYSLMIGEFPPRATNSVSDFDLERRICETVILDCAAVSDPRQPLNGTTACGAHSDTASRSSVVLPGSASDVEKKNGKLTYWQSVARIGVQVAEALQYAHAHGVLHRDIKPANLLLDLRGTVWVTDFGLAKLDDDRDLTQTGDILGTLRYMAPETFKKQADARSEIYSLGLTLYELLAYRPAFEGSGRNSLIQKVMNAQIEPLGKLKPEIPCDLQTIVHKAIDREPQHRYQSAQEFADDLQRFIDDEPIKARRVSSTERLARWSRHNKGLAALLATIAMLVLVLATGSTIAAGYFRSINGALQDTVGDLETAQGDLNEKVKALNNAAGELTNRGNILQATLYAAEMNLAGQAAEDAAGLLRVGQIVDNWFPERSRRDLRGWEWHYLDSLRRADRQTAPCLGAMCIAWSPDGKRFAGGSRDGLLRVWDATTGKLLQKCEGHTDYVQAAAWSPNGAKIATASRDKTIRIWDAATSESLSLLKGHAAAVHCVAWSPDGMRLASTASGSNASEMSCEFKIWNVVTGQPVIEREIHRGEPWVSWRPHSSQVAIFDAVYDATNGERLWMHTGWRACWSADGERLAILTSAGARTLSGRDGETLVELDLEASPARYRAIDWSPSGEFLAVAGDDNTIAVCDASSGRRLAALHGHTDWVLGVQWSPDGNRLLTAGDDTFKIWDWPTRENPVALSVGSEVRSLVWNETGSVVALSGSNGISTCDVDSLRCESRLNIKSTASTMSFAPATAWRPTSRVLATRGNDSTVLFDDREWKERLIIKDLEDVRSIDLSPDGARLVTSAAASVDGEQTILRAFDTATGKQLWVAKLHSNFAGSIRWSPDGTRLACGGWAAAGVVDASDGRLLATFRGKGDHRWIHGIAWDPSSQRVALACMDRTIRILDAANGNERATLVGHTADVMDVSWSPDGSRLASGGKDYTVRVWNASTGAQLMALRGHGSDVNAVAWSPDGLRLASGSWDGNIRIWDASRGYERSGSPAALMSVNRKLEVNPDSIADLQLRLRIYACLGDQAAARRDRERIWRLYEDQWNSDPTNTSVAEELASLLLAEGATLLAEHAQHADVAAIDPGDLRPARRQSANVAILAKLREAVQADAFVGATKLAAAWLICGEPKRAISTLAVMPEDASDESRGLLLAMVQDALGQSATAKASCEQLRMQLCERSVRPEVQALMIEVLSSIGGQDPGEVARLVARMAAAPELARLSQEIERDPQSVTTWTQRGTLRARLGRWRESADDYLHAVRLQPNSIGPWISAAPVLLLAGDEDGYRQHCKAMVEQFRGTKDVGAADPVCKICLLRPGTIEMSELPIQALHEGLDDPQWERFRDWHYACCALVSYRAGNYEDAIDWAAKSPTPIWQPGALTLVIQAMAEHQLGRKEQARRSLAKAEALIPIELRSLGASNHVGPLPAPETNISHNWLIPEILRREAAALIFSDHSDARRTTARRSIALAAKQLH